MTNIGRILKDFYCNGFFGPDYSLDGAVIIAEGYDFIVVRMQSGKAAFADFCGAWQQKKQELIDKWCSYEKETY